MTQLERVLAALKRAGDRGITAYDLSGPRVIDGGHRIMRVAARILELRQQGYDITKAPYRRDGHDVYRLNPAPRQLRVPASAERAPSLFDYAGDSIYSPYSPAA